MLSDAPVKHRVLSLRVCEHNPYKNVFYETLKQSIFCRSMRRKGPVDLSEAEGRAVRSIWVSDRNDRGVESF